MLTLEFMLRCAVQSAYLVAGDDEGQFHGLSKAISEFQDCPGELDLAGV